MKFIEEMPVYEASDPCELDLYSEKMATVLIQKFKDKGSKLYSTSITTNSETNTYAINNVEEVYVCGCLLIENTHYTKTDSRVDFLFTVPARYNYHF